MKGKFRLLLLKMLSSEATCDMKTVGGIEFLRALFYGKRGKKGEVGGFFNLIC